MQMRLRLTGLAFAVPVLAAGIITSADPGRAMADGSSDPVIAAVGDLACDPADSRFNGGLGTATNCQQESVSDALLVDPSVGAVLGLGDFQYDCDDLADWVVSYNPTWGRLDDRMMPVAGNHEYLTGRSAQGEQCPSSNATATNYFNHFGDAASPATNGHFSFDLGTWHLIGLNANCTKSGVGGCAAKSAQTKWLTADLRDTAQPCILAFWHQARFGAKSPAKPYIPWWNVLQAAGTDVILNGHIHNYQRFPALNANGTADPSGPTEYVVGTGGEAQNNLNTSGTPQPVAAFKTFGYLRMTLQADGWTADFVDTSGTVLDSSSGTCH